MSISKGVMQVSEFKNHVMYQVGCSCLDPDHSVTMSVSIDEESGYIHWEFYDKVYWTAYYKDGWFSIQWEKIKAIFKIMFLGYLEMESEINIEQKNVDDLIAAFKEAKETLSKRIESEG